MKLDSSFEDDLQQAVLDSAEQKAREEIAPQLASRTRALLDTYGRRHGYNVDALIDAVETEVTRTDDSVTVTMRLPDPALLFERGTVDHVIEAKGAGVLSFVWSRRHDPPQWVKEEFDEEDDGWRVFLPKVEVSGLPEGRFIRDALHDVRRELEQ